jgi:acetyl esterase
MSELCRVPGESFARRTWYRVEPLRKHVRTVNPPGRHPVPTDLAPESQAIFAMAGDLGLLDHEAGTVEEMRSLARAERQMMGTAPAVGEVEDREIESNRGSLPIRIYRPPGERPRRAILWLHGGGWVIGDLDHADIDCRGLCLETGSTVVSVDYGLAPEHRFPEGLNDAYSALGWLAAELASVPGPSRLAVGGDSAGGNLTAALCLMARARGGPTVDHQLLLYPVTSYECDSASYRQFADGYMLTRELMLRFWDLYTPGPDAGRHTFASVLRAPELRGLPAATFVIAGCDVLRDEGESYAERLRLAGVPVDVLRYPGQLHGFWTYRGATDIATAVNAEIKESLDASG